MSICLLVCLFVCPTAFCVVNLMDTTTTKKEIEKESNRNESELGKGEGGTGNGVRGLANGSHA